MHIGVPAETVAGESRVAATPETVKKIIAQGHTVAVQAGAGVAASVTDAAFEAVGAQITDATGALGAELVLKVRAPSAAELPHMKSGSALVGMLNPFDAEGLQRIATAGLTSLRLVLTQTGVMLFWGLLISLLVLLAMLPGFAGLLIVGPVLGHASWHAYRAAVVD